MLGEGTGSNNFGRNGQDKSPLRNEMQDIKEGKGFSPTPGCGMTETTRKKQSMKAKAGSNGYHIAQCKR